MGLSIGFKKRVGDVVPSSSIERMFVFEDNDIKNYQRFYSLSFTIAFLFQSLNDINELKQNEILNKTFNILIENAKNNKDTIFEEIYYSILLRIIEICMFGLKNSVILNGNTESVINNCKNIYDYLKQILDDVLSSGLDKIIARKTLEAEVIDPSVIVEYKLMRSSESELLEVLK